MFRKGHEVVEKCLLLQSRCWTLCWRSVKKLIGGPPLMPNKVYSSSSVSNCQAIRSEITYKHASQPRRKNPLREVHLPVGQLPAPLWTISIRSETSIPTPPYELQKYRTSMNRMTNFLSMRNEICICGFDLTRKFVMHDCDHYEYDTFALHTPKTWCFPKPLRWSWRCILG